MTDDGAELRLYCLLRGDLEMPEGKAHAQTGHAWVSTLYAAPREQVDAYMAASQPKIVLRAKNQAMIERAAAECRSLGLPHYVVCDAGRTFFAQPTITCLGIGPVTFLQLPKYIQRQRLL